MNSSYMNEKNDKIKQIVEQIDNNLIDLNDLNDELLYELMSYYSNQITIKKQKIKRIRKNIKGENK